MFAEFNACSNAVDTSHLFVQDVTNPHSGFITASAGPVFVLFFVNSTCLPVLVVVMHRLVCALIIYAERRSKLWLRNFKDFALLCWINKTSRLSVGFCCVLVQFRANCSQWLFYLDQSAGRLATRGQLCKASMPSHWVRASFRNLTQTCRFAWQFSYYFVRKFITASIALAK